MRTYDTRIKEEKQVRAVLLIHSKHGKIIFNCDYNLNGRETVDGIIREKNDYQQT